MAFSSPPLGAVVSDLCQAKKQPAQPSDADWMGEAGWHEFHGFLEWFLSRRSTETRYLIEETWQPGRYTEFHIYEPKQRLISAAPFPDRVVHHAVMNVLEPVFEPTFVFDSYACRPRSVGCEPAACRPRSVGCQPAAVSVGPAGAGRPTGQRPVPQRAHVKGAHAAANRFQQYCRRFDYVLKADVRKYFPSIDHEILHGLLARRIKVDLSGSARKARRAAGWKLMLRFGRRFALSRRLVQQQQLEQPPRRQPQRQQQPQQQQCWFPRGEYSPKRRASRPECPCYRR